MKYDVCKHRVADDTLKHRVEWKKIYFILSHSQIYQRYICDIWNHSYTA